MKTAALLCIWTAGLAGVGSALFVSDPVLAGALVALGALSAGFAYSELSD